MAKTVHRRHPKTLWRRLTARQNRRALGLSGAVVVLAVAAAGAWYWEHTAPHIMITSNNLGSVAGGTKMIITGSGFSRSGNTKVYFGDTLAQTVEVPASTTVVAVAPAHSAADVTVRVVNPDGRQASQARAFRYSALKPVISSISPSEGPSAGGTLVTIHGHGFKASAVIVHAHTTVVQPTVIDDETLTFVTPPQAKPVAANVEVSSPDNVWTSDAASYFYR